MSHAESSEESSACSSSSSAGLACASQFGGPGHNAITQHVTKEIQLKYDPLLFISEGSSAIKDESSPIIFEAAIPAGLVIDSQGIVCI